MAALDAVRLRGTTSITGGNSPLIIVDGVIGDMTLPTSVYPTDIESFTILKDASETAQYGSRGASGVINVVTKKGVKGRTSINYSLQKTFYSAATFNPTFPAGKNASGAWDNLTTASQITNPLAWMEVDNREAASYFSARAKVNINLPYRLKLVVFGSYTYTECPYGRVVKVRRES